MCVRVDCTKCGKYSWMGCGKHLVSLYAGIEKGKHCMCKSWPGVVIPSNTQNQNINPSCGSAPANATGTAKTS